MENGSLAGANPHSLDLNKVILVALRFELALLLGAMTLFFSPMQPLESVRSLRVSSLVCASYLLLVGREPLNTSPILLLTMRVADFQRSCRRFSISLACRSSNSGRHCISTSYVLIDPGCRRVSCI